jgi:hypothetical protein
MADFTQTLAIAAPIDHVRSTIALHGDGWWTTNALVSDRVGGVCEFRIPKVGFLARFRVERNDPALIEWQCEESTQPESHGYKDRREWNGTRLRFVLRALSPAETELVFTHIGLVESMECHGKCSMVWSTSVLRSLKQYAETGKGNPV